MSTNTTNSTDLQTSSNNSPEQSNRGNRHYNNDRRQRGGRPYRPHRRYSNPREPPASGSQTPRDLAVTSRTSTNLNDLNDLNRTQSPNESICFICAGPVQYFAVSECNHRLCHLCSLRLRALYENKNCAYCKTEQIKVIFTRKHDKEFQKFEESDIPYFDENLNAYCEDQEMFDDIKLLLKYNCPGTNCDVSCEGWSELKRHIRKVHHLMICDVCIRHKKIFSHEQSLFTQDDLDKHYRDGDEETGFKGHPYCQFCRRTFYGDDELFEHCRDKHEQCFICMRAGIRHHYYCDYNSLEQHFRKEHYLCQDQECLEKKFVVFETDIDLKAHEVSVHGTNLSGQRAKHEARRIGTLYTNSYADSHMRGGRRRSRERQPERRTDGDDGVMVIEEVTRQTRNLNIDSTPSAVNGTTFNARTVRPPPGFGVLSPEEAIGSADESPENEVELRNVAHTSPRIRAEDFPTLSDAMRVNTSNNSGTIKNYSEKVKQKKSKPVDKHKPVDKPKPADKPIQSVASSSRSETPLNFNSHQQTMYGSANKGKTPAFPPLPSANQSTSASSSGSSSSLNYREKALSNPFDSENSSRNSQFHQRISTFLSNNPAKMEDFKSFTTAYNNSILDASSYIEELSLLFNKKKDIGKVVSGLVEILEGEKKKTDLLRAWHDHKAKQTDDFPALEPPYSPISSMTNNSKPNITSPKSPKPSPRVLVIKSSTNRSGDTKASSGPRVWDKIAAIAESKIKEKNNSAFPSLSSAVNNSSNDVWRGSVPKFVQSPPRSESTSSSVNNSPAATNISSFTTTFVKGRPTKAENEEFPGLPLTPKSSHSQQRYNNNVPEKSAWGQGGAFTVSDNSKNENDSEDDSSFSESTKEGGKKKKQKKQKAKTVLFHVGQKNIY